MIMCVIIISLSLFDSHACYGNYRDQREVGARNDWNFVEPFERRSHFLLYIYLAEKKKYGGKSAYYSRTQYV